MNNSDQFLHFLALLISVAVDCIALNY